MSSKFEVVFIEIRSEQDSKLVEFVPRKALAIRVTEDDDELCKKGQSAPCAALSSPVRIAASLSTSG
eukprot:11198437-Lingulodinium_polyedra.AAC.1